MPTQTKTPAVIETIEPIIDNNTLLVLEELNNIKEEKNILKLAFLSQQERDKRKEFKPLYAKTQIKYLSRSYEKYDPTINKFVYGATLRAVSYKFDRNFEKTEVEDMLQDLESRSTYYFDITKINAGDALNGIAGQKTNNKASSNAKKDGGSENTYLEDAQDASLDQLCVDLANDDVSVYKVNLTIKIESESKDSLDMEVKRVIEGGRERGLTFALNVFEQEQEHKYLISRISKYNHFYTDSNLADFLPLYTDYKIDYNGFLLGYKMTNATPYFLNLRSGANKVSLIIASSGSGKSFGVKKMAFNAINDNMKVVIFDPKGEYAFFGNSLGENIGKVFSFTEANSIDIFTFKAQLKNKRHAIYELLKGFIKEEHEAELDMKVADFFNEKETEAKAITEKNKKSIDEVISEVLNWTTFLDFIKDEPFFKDIQRITKGVEHAGIFNGKANITFDQPVTVINLFDIKDSESVPHLLVYLVNILKHELYNKDMDVLLIIDEAYILLQNKRTNRALTNIAKVARGYNTYMMFITQDLEDMEGEAIKILNNSAIKIFLRSEQIQADIMMKHFNLTHEMRNTIVNQGRGQAIIVQNDDKSKTVNQIQISATEYEKKRYEF